MDIKKIITEEILKLEGVGDKYAERFGITDPDRGYQQRTQAAVGYRNPENGRLVGVYQHSAGEERTPIYINPQSLKNFDAGVRAITDVKGNLYIALYNNDTLHADIAGEAKLRRTYDESQYLFWLRQGSSDGFTLSFDMTMWFEDLVERGQQQHIDQRLAVVNNKHPFRFGWNA